MSRQRCATLSLATLLLLGAVPLAMSADEPATPFSDPQTIEDDARARLLLRYKFSMDLDKWIKRAKNDGALTYYRGHLADYRRVAGYLVENQYIPDDPNDTNPRRGSWKADNLSWETFDEGNQGRCIAVLSLMIDRFGNNWVFRNNNGDLRTMGDALRDALDCVYRHQYTEDDAGIPGPWPQSPGWSTGEVKVPGGMPEDKALHVASLRTYNDGATSEIIDALGLFRILLGDDGGRIDETILRCAEGTWQIAAANGYAMPDQCEPDGTPAWGRGHEPASLSPRSTAYAAEIFIVAHCVTGDQKWLDRCEDLYRWLERYEVGRGEWEHFLEPGTNRPIWGDGKYNIVRQRSRAMWPGSPFGALEEQPARVRTGLGYYELLLRDFVPTDPPGEGNEQADEPQADEPPAPELEVVQEEVRTNTLKPTSVVRTSGGGGRRGR